MRKLVNALAALSILAFAAVTLSPAPAEARVGVFVGVGGPWWGWPGPYYYPYPPPPVVYVPPTYYPPAVYVVPPTPLAAQAQTWYYCDNPAGYYPYVRTCASGWRQVPAQSH